MFGSTRRYLAYTRKVPSAVRVSQLKQSILYSLVNCVLILIQSLAQGRITLIDLKVVPANDRSPLGYLPLAHTHDDSENY